MDSQVLYKYGPMVLISLGTYLGGLFTEPVKKWLNNRAERKRLRRALYAEMEANFSHFVIYISGLKSPDTYPRFEFDQMFKTEVYFEALKQPILFRELREAQTTSEFYEALARTRTLPEAEQPAWLQKFADALLVWVKQGLLSRRLLYRVHASALPSAFQGPFTVWLGKKYRQVAWRNMASQRPSQPGGAMAFLPPRTLFGRIRAFWRGIPGDPT